MAKNKTEGPKLSRCYKSEYCFSNLHFNECGFDIKKNVYNQ